ncbi:hypothetical protein BGZ61DRAFT_459615 [Ilyonectria robusta]|uniref:uncharacterized protein n=1 Tax=Ilyonectria robusta TaxID=1079257 RepID=UPI001E8DF17D|nr:uncharacterized protein BGZ61DRAFT_459615 [Ilyonectria robusta]KAH8670575.1 hypothetical protein BGZ61DRAFT_459615 [Ilyonectria robusta]
MRITGHSLVISSGEYERLFTLSWCGSAEKMGRLVLFQVRDARVRSQLVRSRYFCDGGILSSVPGQILILQILQ